MNPPLSDWLDHAGATFDARKPTMTKAPEVAAPPTLAVEPGPNARAAAHLAAADRARRKVDELNEMLRANDLARKQILAQRQDEVLAYDREYQAAKALLVPARAYLPLQQGY